MKVNLIAIISILILGCAKTEKFKENIEKDDFYEKCRKLVLSENKIGKEYLFQNVGNKIDELNVKYLGNSVLKNGDTIRIITSVNYTGLYEDSRKANASIYLYNFKNQKIGYYNVGGVFNLPSEIKNNSMIFRFENEQCNQTTLIKLYDSIPRNIYVKCTPEAGDIYDLQK